MDEKRSSPEIARSQKIENLIKKVAENKSRARMNNRYPTSQQNNNLQVRFHFCQNLININPYLLRFVTELSDPNCPSLIKPRDKTGTECLLINMGLLRYIYLIRLRLYQLIN